MTKQHAGSHDRYRTRRLLLLAVVTTSVVACGAEPAQPPRTGKDPNGPGTPVDSRVASGKCGLEQPAFCETFEEKHPGGRGGPLDERQWAFSRFGHTITRFFSRIVANSQEERTYANTPTFCGSPFSALVTPEDVAVCDGVGAQGDSSGQFTEVLADGDGFAINSMMIRQPFDFTARTGTIVFDLDAKRNEGFDGHGWWTEVWINEDPAPIPYHGAPTIASYPRLGVGFQIAPASLECFETAGANQIGRLVVSKDYEITSDVTFGGECFGAEDSVLNRFEIRISETRAEFWASNADDPSNVRRVGSVDFDLGFSTGYVHFQHAQYNAFKGGRASSSQAYRWDNIGFDGPTYPIPRSYDVPDELEPIEDSGELIARTIGYYIGRDGMDPDELAKSFTLKDVDVANAQKATFNFNLFTDENQVLEFRFNGNDWQRFEVPNTFSEFQLRSFSTDVPLSQLVSGDNELEVRLASRPSFHVAIGNMDLTVVPFG